MKKTFGGGSTVVDEKAEEHKQDFISLVRDLKNAFRHDGYAVAAAVNPNVNATGNDTKIPVYVNINYNNIVTIFV